MVKKRSASFNAETGELRHVIRKDVAARANLINAIERDVITGLLKQKGYLGQTNLFDLAKEDPEYRKGIEFGVGYESRSLCSVPGCSNIGAISDSPHHDNENEPRWLCRHHHGKKDHAEHKPMPDLDVQQEMKKLMRAIGKRIEM